jgi:hypothetical protein
MPASKAEQVLGALKGLLETLPGATVDRNSVLLEEIPNGGLIILREGDPGEPEHVNRRRNGTPDRRAIGTPRTVA